LNIFVVTGASSGLGKAVVEHALSKGDKVSATCRKPSDLAELASKYPPSQLIVLQLDVTSTSDIGIIFAKAIDAFGRVDIVYNNAGYAAIGEAEGTSEEVGRRLYDVNFWGAINVSKEAVKVFREVNKPIGGVLLQASSVVGVSGHAGGAIYSSRCVSL
jgi:NAD(P)-dependent dehydrogenase (short-subunit alcohol dehydrogenase family)